MPGAVLPHTGAYLELERERRTRRLPAALVVATPVVGLAAAQGGYFATSWGWSTTALLWIVGLWAVVSGRTDAGRLDMAFLALLGLVTAWVGLSVTWSAAPALSVLELERTLLLVAGTAALLLVARRRDATVIAWTLVGAIDAIALYALATRLAPDRLGSYDPIAVYRLSAPIGYWNGLGIFAVMGLLLAVGLTARATRPWHRAAAAASVVPLAAALYFTYSRGAWVALGVGIAVLVAATPRRLHVLLATVVVGAPAALGVVLASRSYALTHRVTQLDRAVDDGRNLALTLLVLCAIAIGLALLLDAADRRVSIPRRARLAVGASIWLAVAVAIVAGVVQHGGPIAVVERGWDAFAAPPPRETTSLNSRLTSFSGNGRVELWSAARDVYADNPLTGGGAGSFERFWQARADATQRVRDAHGLYVETLAELGPVGLALLLAVLATPLVGLANARRTPLVGGAAGAYVAFLLHAGVDWDWELSGVTLTGLFVGCILLLSSRTGDVRLAGSGARLTLGSVGAVAGVVASIAALGNGTLASARDAVDRGDVSAAISDAHRADQLMPWSPEPSIVRGEAELAGNDNAAAARSFRAAIAQDPDNWRAWLDLAIATRGAKRTNALARARSLYPRSTEIASTAAKLEAS